MPLNLAGADPLLKEAYEGALRETLNQEVPLFKHLDQSDRQYSGRRVVFPFHTARTTAVGARPEGATLPSASSQVYVTSVISATYHYGRGQITGQAAASGKNAFVDTLDSELKRTMQDLVQDLSRQSWGTGDGRLAQIALDSNSNTAVTVFNRFAAAKSGSPGGRWIVAGQSLDAGTVASPTGQTSGVIVISVAQSSNPATTSDTITISNSALNFSACDTYLFNGGAGGLGVEMQGMQALVDVWTDTNYYQSNAFVSQVNGINRASVGAFNSLVLHNSGTTRILDGNLMQQAFDEVSKNTGLGIDMIMGHHDVVRAFLDSVSADRRYMSPQFNAGVQALTYNGIPLEKDRHAPYNALFLINKECIKQYTLLDLEFADDDGSILNRVTNQDSWEFFIRTYRNLGFDAYPKGCLSIRDVRVDL